MEFVSYLPGVATYKIYYPENFSLDEEEESGIVSITSPEGQNMTISSYSANAQITEDVLLAFFKELTEEYYKISELKSSVTGRYLSCEQHFTKDNYYWVIWFIAKASQVIAITVNTEKELNKEEYNLFRFMAENMEVLDKNTC